MGDVCAGLTVGLAVTCLALVVSLCLNAFLCLLRYRTNRRREGQTTLTLDNKEEFYPCVYTGNRFEGDEVCCLVNADDIQLQENPIYGNIDANRGTAEGQADSVCYESMVAGAHTGDIQTRQRADQEPADLNYASLDLNVAKKKRRQKRRHQQRGPAQRPAGPQSRLSQPLFLEEEGAEAQACLPSRDSSPMASTTSIYLNSQQMALEAEERDRERERSRDRSRKYARDQADRWEGHRDGARGRDWGTGEVEEGGSCIEMDGEGDGRGWGAEEVCGTVSQNVDRCCHPAD